MELLVPNIGVLAAHRAAPPLSGAATTRLALVTVVVNPLPGSVHLVLCLVSTGAGTYLRLSGVQLGHKTLQWDSNPRHPQNA